MGDSMRSGRLQAQLGGVMNCLANSQQEVERLRSLMPKIELVFQDESAIGYGDPSVTLYVDDVQRDKVWAYITKEKGADGGWYRVIKFKRSGDEKQ